MRDEPAVALICAVMLEARPLLARLAAARREAWVGGKPTFAGHVREQPVIVVAGGMGKTNAAHALTVLLERHAVREVVCFGVGGAYPHSGLEVGDLALATEEVYGDEGVNTADSWLSTAEIGIPLLQRPGQSRFNRFPLNGAQFVAAQTRLRAAGVAFTSGPFVTVSACSGTAAEGRKLRRRFRAVCESMEGAAAAHVAAWYEVPFVEVRGISNRVEDRDLARWDLAAAAEAAAHAAWVVAHSPAAP